MDYTLKFKTEAAANKVLFTTVDGVITNNYPGHSIDIIGVIYKPTGKTISSEEGDYPEMALIPGWHVNVRGAEDKTLAKYHVEVSTPVRGWA